MGTSASVMSGKTAWLFDVRGINGLTCPPPTKSKPAANPRMILMLGTVGTRSKPVGEPWRQKTSFSA